jgi:hypothetical protein
MGSRKSICQFTRTCVQKIPCCDSHKGALFNYVVTCQCLLSMRLLQNKVTSLADLSMHQEGGFGGTLRRKCAVELGQGVESADDLDTSESLLSDCS